MSAPRPMRDGDRRMGGAICALMALIGGCATARQAAPVEAPPASTYRIGAGDTLEVIVWKEDQISGKVIVRHDGMITVPLVGDIPAAGLTPETLAADIRGSLTRVIDNPNVVVRVAAAGSRRFFVIGNVKAPGTYELSANQTLLQGLAVAGGFTDFADRKGVRIIRQSGAAGTIPLDYNAIIRGDAPDLFLQPNDTIVVP